MSNHIMPMNKKFVVGSIRLTPQQWDRLDAASRYFGISRSEFMRRAINDAVAYGLGGGVETTPTATAASTGLSEEGQLKVLECAYGTYQAILMLGAKLIDAEWQGAAHQTIKQSFEAKSASEGWLPPSKAKDTE